MNTSSFHGSRKAFTLIELLVVIAIIAILAAILFPVFAQARAKARQATCQSNLKQLGLAFAQYSQDYDETMPLVTVYSGIYTGFLYDWDILIKPYTGVRVAYNAPTTVFQCPEDSIRNRYTGTPRTYAMARGRGRGAAQSAITLNGSTVTLGRTLADFPEPAGTFLLVEQPTVYNVFGTDTACVCDGPFYVAGQVTSTQDNDSPSGTTPVPVSPAIHSGGWDYLFCDGHVKWMRPEATLGKGTAANPLGPWSIAAND